MEIGGEESWGNGYGPAKHLPREQGLVQAKVEVAQVHVLARVHARAGAEFRGILLQDHFGEQHARPEIVLHHGPRVETVPRQRRRDEGKGIAAGDPQQPFSIRPADESLVKPLEGSKDFPPDHDRGEGDPVGQQQALEDKAPTSGRRHVDAQDVTAAVNIDARRVDDPHILQQAGEMV